MSAPILYCQACKIGSPWMAGALPTRCVACGTNNPRWRRDLDETWPFRVSVDDASFLRSLRIASDEHELPLEDDGA